MNNKFWIVITMLLSVNLLTQDTVNADDDALARVEIFNRISPKKTWNIPGTLDRRFTWQFDNQKYTVLMAINEQQYNKFSNQKLKRGYNHAHFAPMVYKGVDSLKKLIIEFKEIIPNNWIPEKKVNFVLAFVQKMITYEDDKTTGYDEFYKHAIETLAEGEGDCEDTSILFAAILSGLGFKSALLVLPPVRLGGPGHVAVGVKGDFKGWYFPYKNDKYFFCETARNDTKVKLGMMSETDANVDLIDFIPITRNPVPPKKVRPRTVPPRPKPPSPPSPQRAFQIGINLYYETRYNEAIKSLQLALSGLSDPKQRAKAYIYLGAAEYTFPGHSLKDAKARAKVRFKQALRENPEQEIMFEKFRGWFEEVRKESIGELTVSASLPQTEIWINGNEINRKKLGNGTSRINLKLFKGTYTIEGVYEGVSEKQKIEIAPNTHKELEIEIPPIAKHTPVSEVSVGEIIPLTLSLTSHKRPNQVKVYYNTYDKNNKELERNNKKMLLSRRDRVSLIWTYEVDLPSQKRAGSIRYYIQVEYEDRMVVRHPKSRYRYHQISITDDESPIDNKSPTIVLRNPPKTVSVNQEITIKAEVTDDTAVKSVYLFYAFSRSRNFKPSQYYRRVLTKTYLDIYTGRILPQKDPGYIWYYLTATDKEGNEGKTEKRVLEIKPSRKPVPPSSDSQPPRIVLQDTIRTSEVNQRIPIKAKVTDDVSVKSVYLFYGFSRSRISEPSKYYMKALTKNTLDIYTGHISPQREVGYIWYYLTAIDKEGKRGKSAKRVLEIKSSSRYTPKPTPTPPMVLSTDQSSSPPIVHQGIWTSHAWSDDVLKGGGSTFGLEQGNAFSFAYLREGKTHQTFGAQLDFYYQNSLNPSITFQWGPALGKSPIVFAFLGGFAGDTPFLGTSLKLYPIDRVSIDVTLLRSVFDTTHPYHYEMGIRVYKTRELNLQIGSQWNLGNGNITKMQIGFGFTF